MFSTQRIQPKLLAQEGEALAARFLQQKGFSILYKNYHSQYGEIDLIAHNASFLVFVEVKTRSSANRENLIGSVTPRKQKRLSQTAALFLQSHPQYEEHFMRFDVILITYHAQDNNYSIEHLEDAFNTQFI
jgi:putative endonuclease